jgi:anti-sigma regulatory factor (Ser/Thr protein kinase)
VNKTFPARPSALQDVRSFIRERAREVSFHPEVVDDLVVAVSEACANSLLHSRSRVIEVRWKPTIDGAEVEVLDGGVYDHSDNGPVAGPRLGYGIQLMRALVDEVGIEGGTEGRPGTRVTLVMRKRAIRPPSLADA